MVQQVLIPDVGEAQEVEVIEILVKVGDSVEIDDSLVVLESDKASMEIPSPFAGKVLAIKVSEGEIVDEGALILELETSDTGQTAQADPEQNHAEEKSAQNEVSAEEAQKDAAPPAESPVLSGKDSGNVPGKTSEQIIVVPDVGEANDITVTEILVKVGDIVAVDDSLVVLESDKASMEIPAPYAGEILEILTAEEDTVEEGDDLIRINAVGGQAPSAVASSQTQVPAPQVSDSIEPGIVKQQTLAVESPAAEDAPLVHAGPAVRKHARQYGVDLTAVEGSGRRGRILDEDLRVYIKKRLKSEPAMAAGGSGIPAIPEIDFSKFGEIEKVPLSRIKRATARNLHRSWLNVPHVTQFDEADITELEVFRKSQNEELAASGVKLTPLAFMISACVSALVRFPQFNASLEPGYESLILKKYYNMGIAVETPEGLVVPVLKDVDKKGIIELGNESAELAKQARDKKLPLDAMQGATFTISSLGGIGGTAFTPIVNAPEVAILGVARARVSPVWDGKQFMPRTILPLSLSYDHRAIDGAEAARFTGYLSRVLTDIRRLLL